MRTHAKSEFEKNFFKLANNAVFGKTMENVRNRKNYMVVDNVKKYNKYVQSINFVNVIKLSDTLCLVERKNTDCVLNKPIICGI
jgi:hypothetical protein